tara:strand:+ start:585 stop:728 length:144 start_codon:yes stop_codon:yes gene_type:complete
MGDKKKSGYKFISDKFVYGGYAPNLYKHDWKTPAWNVEVKWDDDNDK